MEIIINNCGSGGSLEELESLKSDPNFVFQNDPNFETLTLYDSEGNVINVNSWIECANYVNGGWTNSFNNFSGDTFLIVITVGITISYFISKKFLSGRN